MAYLIYILVAATGAVALLLILSLIFAPLVTAFDVAWNLTLAAVFLLTGFAFLKRRRWAASAIYVAVFMFYTPSLLSLLQGHGWRSTGYLPSALVLVIILCFYALPAGTFEDRRSESSDPS